jgi:hypothetical protein
VAVVLAVAAGALGVSGWGAGAGAADAAATPANVVLGISLPGFTPAPAGAFNGPVSAATLVKVTDTDDPDMLSEIENGSIDAYLRCWNRRYGRTNGVLADLVMRFPDATQSTQFLENFDLALKAESDVSSFPLSSPSGAHGYTAHGVVVAGSTNYAVSVARGRYAIFVLSATPAGGVSLPQIELLAYAQWAALPRSSGAGAGAGGGEFGSISAGPLYLLPPATLSSSGVGGLEALLVLVIIVVALGVLALFAVDALGRRQEGRARGEGEVEGGAGPVGEAGPRDQDEGQARDEAKLHPVFAEPGKPGEPGGPAEGA